MAEDKKITPTIVTIVGDSLTLPRQFQQVEFHHTYPYLLVRWLREMGRYRHIESFRAAERP